ncbi:MAG TPA: C39 family peptidase [Chloroflexota bacterium]|nr:C39 family peptidase [Chloroflexota bacterium]
MPQQAIRLRHERRYARRANRWRWPALLAVGAGALVWGAACWAPVAPAPLSAVAPTAVESSRGAATPGRPAATSVPTRAPLSPPVSQPVVAPTPTPAATGQALLASVRAELAAQWLKNHTETPLRAGPDEQAPMFTSLPQWTVLKQLESRPGWLQVYYSGDGDTRQPGPGWVRAADVGGIDPPPLWLTTAQSTALFAGVEPGATRRLDLPPATAMEVRGLDPGTGSRLHVRLPGNGRGVPPAEGWVEAGAAAHSAPLTAGQIPWSYPSVLTADVRMAVPYRTQLDGSDYAGANCGPTVLGMVLEANGHNLEPRTLRDQVLDAEDFPRWDDDAGSYIWALARVAEANGVKTFGLFADAAETRLHRWSLDDVRQSVRAGRPVVVQVVYRGLPKRQDSPYRGDHYIVVTGLVGDDFLYNDPIGGPVEGPGWDRVMSPVQLERAMNASDTPFTHTAFAVSLS